MHPNHLLFDLDGTLTDPQEGITRCIVYALEQLQVSPPSRADLVQYIGPPLPECFSQLLQTDDVVKIEGAIAIFRERFATIGLFENDLYAGILTMLETFQNQGKQLYIATSKPEVYAQRILDHFNLSPYFQSVHGSTLDGRRRHKADIIHQAILTNNIPVENAIMIGDRKHDVLGAAHHQLPCIGVLWGYGSQAELTTAGAKALCSDPDQLLNLLAMKDQEKGQEIV